MAISSTSIADIEQQIAKVTLQLEHARAQQFVAAEKTYLAAKKAAELARNKVRELMAKAGSTVAAQNRLLTALANAEQLEIQLSAAEEIFNALEQQQRAAEKFSRKVGKVLAGKSLGKKITFTKAEKKVIKKDKKIARKKMKADKKDEYKPEHEQHELAVAPAADLKQISETPPTERKPAKKAPVKKPAAKKNLPKAQQEIASEKLDSNPGNLDGNVKNLQDKVEDLQSYTNPTESSALEASEIADKPVDQSIESVMGAESAARETSAEVSGKAYGEIDESADAEKPKNASEI